MLKSENYFRALFDLDQSVPIVGGSHIRYINFDNAASTPPLRSVTQAVIDFLPWYSSVHRGTGYKSRFSTEKYEEARKRVLRFFGATEEHLCIFGKNSTEAMNLLANRFPFTKERNIVLIGDLEHHSNDLPFRKRAKVIRIGLNADGTLDEVDLDQKLAQYKEQIALISISGGSNVTGTMPNIYKIAEKAHQIGAQIAVDCAQLAPHRTISMKTLNDPDHLDYIAVSSHKMYAPFGTGALIGRKETFEMGDPYLCGGGTVDLVTPNMIVWSGLPDKEEAGSQNIVGVVAFAAALEKLEEIGMDKIAQHEAELTEYVLERMNQIPKLHLFGESDPKVIENRLGVITFSIEGMHHALVAAILSSEFGIGVRSGCFCAHPYLMHLLGIDSTIITKSYEPTEKPGLVRISFGMYNTKSEIDRFIAALQIIVVGKYAGKYVQNEKNGEWDLVETI